MTRAAGNSEEANIVCTKQSEHAVVATCHHWGSNGPVETLAPYGETGVLMMTPKMHRIHYHRR